MDGRMHRQPENIMPPPPSGAKKITTPSGIKKQIGIKKNHCQCEGVIHSE